MRSGNYSSHSHKFSALLSTVLNRFQKTSFQYQGWISLLCLQLLHSSVQTFYSLCEFSCRSILGNFIRKTPRTLVCVPPTRHRVFVCSALDCELISRRTIIVHLYYSALHGLFHFTCAHHAMLMESQVVILPRNRWIAI